MNDVPVRYGPHSPFDNQEREVIHRIYARVRTSRDARASELLLAIRKQMVCLEWLGETFSQYPSPFDEQTLGDRRRGLETLADTLSLTNPANFDFHVPTRAFLGRSMAMAESNFYRLLRHICRDLFKDGDGEKLRDAASRRLRICLYSMLVEEILTGIASDNTRDRPIRREAVMALAQVWERRLSYRVSDFFPLLEATWEARQRISVIGGTLMGTQEMFDLFKAGCDPKFVHCFTRLNPSSNEIEAFREFLFDRSSEELERLAGEMAEAGIPSILLEDPDSDGERDAVTVFFEFFRSRHLQAQARRLANLPGPKQTAEGYVMIYYLGQTKA